MLKLPKGVKKDIEKIIDYLYDDEKRHYEEYPIEDHIYLVLKRVKKWLKGTG